MNGYNEDDFDNTELTSIEEELERKRIGYECVGLPNELYHYCSYETFEKIVRGKRWRFASINGTNDISENLNRYVLQMLLKRGFVEHPKLTLEMRKDIIRHIINQNDPDNKNFFIACFSTERDDLGQWRVPYGDYGKGVCIGINPKFFTDKEYILNDSNYGWTPINYSVASQKVCMNNIIKKHLNNNEPDYWDIRPQEIGFDIRDYSLTMKHKAFKIENEWRIVVARIENATLGDCNFTHAPEISGRKALFYNIKQQMKDCPSVSFITSVTLGPQCKKTVEEVEELLKTHKIKCNSKKIKKSTIPYVFNPIDNKK